VELAAIGRHQQQFAAGYPHCGEGFGVAGNVSNGQTALYRYRFGTVEFDESRLELHVGGLIVDIEPRPLQVLSILLARTDQVVSKQELLDTVWEGRVTVENVLYNALTKLRKALRDDASELIVTVPRMGYKFAGPVERFMVQPKLTSRLDFRIGAAVPGREHFHLHAQIGATRHCEVWVARHFKTQEPRVYKFGVDGERLASFKREATLGRLLQDSLPNRDDIARILDWNFETLPFYLESEYGGENLAVWAAQENRLRAQPVAARLEMFLQVADAVAAAHSVGVLHKDLKPANILVAPRGEQQWRLRVGDFGSGWLLEPGRLEELGITQNWLSSPPPGFSESTSGTSLYLAPELIAGQMPTVQSDVYALGVILYQLAIGDLSRPMASGWDKGISDELLREDIAAATDGEPGQRLSAVAELAQRLRTLEERRVERTAAREAHARLVAERQAADRMRARRPWVALAMASLVLGLAFSLWLYQGQREARFEAEAERRRAEQINRFLSEDLLGATDPSGPGGAHNPTMREVLAATQARIDSRFADDPETRASIDLALGKAYFGMTDYPQAEQFERAAFDTLARTRGAADAATLEAEYTLISVLIQTNRLDEAVTLLDAADHLAGDRLQANSQLAFKAHWSRGGLYKLRMAPDKALAEYQAADRVRAAIDPANDSLMLRLRDSLSWCYARLNRNDEAASVLRDVITPAYTPDRVGPVFWAQARVDYGIALKADGKNADAERILSEALMEIRHSLGPTHFFVAVVQNELGDLYSREGQWPKAVQSLSEAYAVLRLRSGEHGQATLIVAANLGIIEYRTGQTQRAIDTLTPLYDDLKRQLGVSSPQAEAAAFYLSCALSNIGRYREAGDLIPSLVATDLEAAEPRGDWTQRLDALRGEVLLGQGHTTDGLAMLTKAVNAMASLTTPDDDLSIFRKALDAERHR
jgi:non-specific serine/threonine protein kinase